MKRQLPGSLDALSRSQPSAQRYLVDTSIGHPHAKALSVARWRIESVAGLFGVDDKTQVLDEEIIPRCGAEDIVWLTFDKAAKHEHEELTKLHQTCVLWISRPKHGLSSAYIHAMLAVAIMRVDPLFSSRDSQALHLRMNWRIDAEPVEQWRGRHPRRRLPLSE